MVNEYINKLTLTKTYDVRSYQLGFKIKEPRVPNELKDVGDLGKKLLGVIHKYIWI